MITESIKNLVQKACSDVGFEVGDIALEHPEKLEHGDYSTNVALVLAKKQNKDPREVAEEIRAKILDTKYQILNTSIEKIEAAGPGFINFSLSGEYLLKELQEIVRKKEKYGMGKTRETIVIDYSSPNIAKSFGIGHLRSTIIGQAIYNLYKFLGYKTIGDNHVGDWGTQFGKLLYEIDRKGWWKEKLSIDNLENAYLQFHKYPEGIIEMEESARKWFKKLEDGDKEVRRKWEEIKEASLKEFDRTYDLLDVKIDYTLGESFYEPMLKDVVEEVKKRGLAKKSRGALIIEFPNDALPPAILLKSDEATSYFTRDLAAIKYRLKRWNPRLIVYEVGVEQSLHLRQVFWTAELLGWARRERFVHIGHGLYRGKEGKFSTREGQTIHLEKVLGEAIDKAKEIIEQSETARGLSEQEKAEVAKAVGIGGIKYNDLSQHPSGDIVFNWGKILNLKGNSAPYLQYTYARCKSIARKAGNPKSEIRNPKQLQNFTKEEFDILRMLYRFPEVAKEAAEKFSPNLLCAFVFDVAQRYNLFYNTSPVLKAETKELKNFRLLLTAAVAQVLKNGLTLLGIKTLERM